MKWLGEVRAGETVAAGPGTLFRDGRSGDYYIYTWGWTSDRVMRRVGVECQKTQTGWDVTYFSESNIQTRSDLDRRVSYARVDHLYKRSLNGKRRLVYTRTGIE